MPETETGTNEVQWLRRYIRDLAALSALPVVWTESDPRRIAESLADALLHMPNLDFVSISIAGDPLPAAPSAVWAALAL